MSEEFEKYVDNPLWPILVDTVHAMPMYPHHKAYVTDRLLNTHPAITPRELAVQLGIPLGEALVILSEVRSRPGFGGTQPSAT